MPIETALSQRAEYQKTLSHLVADQKTLREILSEEGGAVLASYDDAQIKLQDLAERSAFTQGFCLGAKIMLDVLEEKRV